MQHGSGRGKRHSTARSLQQLDTELPLELSDRSGQRWLGDAQAVGSTAEVQLLCYRDEIPQLASGAARMLDRMSEQTITLVTGANKGIGYAIAAGLGALGWSVGVGARDDQRREEAVAKLIAAGVAAFGVALDVTDAFNGTQTPEQGAAIAIRLATLPDDGPTGGLFDDKGIVPW